MFETSESVKVREGYVKGHAKLFQTYYFSAVRSGPWRVREDLREANINNVMFFKPCKKLCNHAIHVQAAGAHSTAKKLI